MYLIPLQPELMISRLQEKSTRKDRPRTSRREDINSRETSREFIAPLYNALDNGRSSSSHVVKMHLKAMPGRPQGLNKKSIIAGDQMSMKSGKSRMSYMPPGVTSGMDLMQFCTSNTDETQSIVSTDRYQKQIDVILNFLRHHISLSFSEPFSEKP